MTGKKKVVRVFKVGDKFSAEIFVKAKSFHGLGLEEFCRRLKEKEGFKPPNVNLLVRDELGVSKREERKILSILNS